VVNVLICIWVPLSWSNCIHAVLSRFSSVALHTTSTYSFLKFVTNSSLLHFLCNGAEITNRLVKEKINVHYYLESLTPSSVRKKSVVVW
jgi:hypothetical protein